MGLLMEMQDYVCPVYSSVHDNHGDQDHVVVNSISLEGDCLGLRIYVGDCLGWTSSDLENSPNCWGSSDQTSIPMSPLAMWQLVENRRHRGQSIRDRCWFCSMALGATETCTGWANASRLRPPLAATVKELVAGCADQVRES